MLPLPGALVEGRLFEEFEARGVCDQGNDPESEAPIFGCNPTNRRIRDPARISATPPMAALVGESLGACRGGRRAIDNLTTLSFGIELEES
jgi:hypothetical protein